MARANDDHDDRALGEAARRGERAAFDEIVRRHAAPTWRLALAVSRDPASAGSAVAAGFASVLARPTDDRPSPWPLGVDLVVATRAAARHAAELERIVRPATGAMRLDASQARLGFVSRAFDTLPERWRSALWLVDVEGWPVVDAAAALEMAPTSVLSMLDRARLGLREQVLVGGLRRPSPPECRRTTNLLTGYAAGTLREREAAMVRQHLDACADCRERLGAIDDLVPVLRAGAVVLPVSLAEQAAARWSSAVVHPVSRWLALPGGRPLPAWAERAFAGSVAAVVSLGLAAATLLATRDRGAATIPGPPVAAAAPPQVLSEPTVPGTSGAPPFAVDPVGVDAPYGAARGAAALGRTSARLPTSTSSLDGTVSGSSSGGGSTYDAQPSNPPPSSPPVDDSTLAANVGGVGGVALGEDCAGGHAFGSSAGCAPSDSSGDPISVGGALVP